MGRYLVRQATLKGSIEIPSSKSHTLRAILFGTMGHGKSVIHHYLPSPDADAMVQACRLLGGAVEVSPQQMIIEGTKGKIDQAEDVIHAGNSGIVLRFCCAIAALGGQPIVITGDHSIRHQRPIKPLLESLSQLGAFAISTRKEGYAPVIVQGPIQSGKATIVGEDSQYVSALLIASCFANGPIELSVQNPGEKPWVALTLNWLDRLGIFYKNEAFQRYRVLGNTRYEGFEYTVPGDFSSAAFPIAAALITHSELTLHNLDMSDSQGDKKLIYLFQKMGAKIEIDDQKKTLHVKKSGELLGIDVDINDCIDAITILAVVACFAEGETRITNGAIARHKECNRIHCVKNELQKMGGDIQEIDDGLYIKKSSLKGAHVHSYGDHRMAMSLVVAALGAVGETVISSVECVSKTFPTFVRDFNALGANIRPLV